MENEGSAGNPADYVSIDEAARIKEVTRVAIWGAINAGKLETAEFFGQKVVSRASLAAYTPRNYPRKDS